MVDGGEEQRDTAVFRSKQLLTTVGSRLYGEFGTPSRSSSSSLLRTRAQQNSKQGERER